MSCAEEVISHPCVRRLEMQSQGIVKSWQIGQSVHVMVFLYINSTEAHYPQGGTRHTCPIVKDAIHQASSIRQARISLSQVDVHGCS